ncbi:MAG: Flp pilus assembly complex ATPase component TadA [Deltaproteobacteria bacterium]|nr:Flp pilus assembly complex ATPase component TadA [Deltaproteobacteria bacterium]
MGNRFQNKTNVVQEKSPFRLGDVLIKKKLISEMDLERALGIQEFERKLQNQPIGQILVEMNALNKTEVEGILDHPQLREKLGKIAIEQGLITEDELNDCLKHKKDDQLIGQVLVNRGYLCEEDLAKLLNEQISSPKFGQLAVNLGLVDKETIRKALRIQSSSRRLGEILCDIGIINPIDLNRCLHEAKKSLDVTDTFIEMGFITEDELNRLKSGFELNEDEIGEVLVKKNIISEVDLQTAYSRHYNIPFETLRGFSYNPDEKLALSRIISKKYSESKLILPISLYENELTIALFKPTNDFDFIYELKNMYRGFNIHCMLVTKEKFEELFEVLYSAHLGISGAKDIDGLPFSKSTDIDVVELNIDENKVPVKELSLDNISIDMEVEELVNFILSYGITNDASDIHIEQSRKGVKLRYRFDGILRETDIGWLKEKIEEKAPSVVSRIKILSNLDITEKRLPQDGSFRMNYFDKENKQRIDLDFRVAVCKGALDENVTIRILDPRNAERGLESLNHSPHIVEPFKQLLKTPAGIVLVVGPTGSGKTSTLYAALNYIDDPGIKIITAEDPIEYQFPNIMQTQVNPKINLTFARLLRSFLRFDPDVIFVGEIRDEETAKIAFDAAQTGHLILSTLHTNDSIGAISRLTELGVEYGQLSSSLMCVLAQRLVRKICPLCIEEYLPEKKEWEHLFKTLPSHLRFYRGAGCEKCHQSGYDGRIVLSEIFILTPEITHALNKGYYDENQFTKLVIESGMKTMIDDGISKLSQTTLSEILRMLPHDMIRKFRSRQHSQQDVDLLVEELLEGKYSEANKDMAIEESTSFELVNPETEKAKLDLILGSYETALKKKMGNDVTPVDSQVFKEFLVESFYKVYERQPCKSITFNIQENNRRDKIEIFAVPNI